MIQSFLHWQRLLRQMDKYPHFQGKSHHKPAKTREYFGKILSSNDYH